MAKEPEVKATETKEPVAEKPANVVAFVVDVEAEAKDAGFIKMVKEDVVSFVNAACVDAHKAIGWVVREYKSL